MKNKNGRKVKKLRWNRTFVVLASVLVLAIGLVGTTLAWIFTSTEEINNIFNPAKVTTSVEESFNGQVKNDVKVKNTGNIDAYLRAMVVVNWQDGNGNVKAAKSDDYTITWKLDGWVKQGEYYYYTSPVAPGGLTKELFTECKPLVEAPEEGYELCVEILADGIQSEPASAVVDAWGVNPSTLKSGN